MSTDTYISNSFLILARNLNGLTKRKNELLVILQNNRMDIALISKTHFTHSSYINLLGFNTFITNDPGDTTHAGDAIIIRASLLFYLLPLY
jgi:hypothetical protein